MAPSPTGYLHVGTARSALFNWFFARKNGGKFILRIEDTDIERSKKEYEDDIVSGLKWLGLNWDEFYRQSDRLPIYATYLKKLFDQKKAFWCYHTEEELEEERKQQTEKKELPRHVCGYKNTFIENGRKGIIRLVVDENSSRKIKYTDAIKGDIEFEERLLGDFSIAKDSNTPLYNFAVVVDDYEMAITHVIRGEDHISNTPKQLLIQEALGIESPIYAHLPLLLGEDRSKLSKRNATVGLNDYHKLGYLPEAIVNFLSLLGWSPEETDKEMMALTDIVGQFSLEKVHKSSAIFDIKKLNWLNARYLKTKNDDQFLDLAMPHIEKHFGVQERNFISKFLPMMRERLEYLDQVREFHYFFEQPEYDQSLLIWKKTDKIGATKAIRMLKDILLETAWNRDNLKEKSDKLAIDEFAGDRGAVYWPLRVALSGEKFSPDPLDLALILGKEESLKRIEEAGIKLE